MKMKRKFIRSGALLLLLVSMLLFTLLVANLKDGIDSLAFDLQESFYGFAVSLTIVFVVAILAVEKFVIAKENQSLLHDIKLKAIKNANEKVVFECDSIKSCKSFIGKYLFMSNAFAILLCITIGMTCSYGETSLIAFTVAYMLCMILMGINELYFLYCLHQRKYLWELMNFLCIQANYVKLKADWDDLNSQNTNILARLSQINADFKEALGEFNKAWKHFTETILKKETDEQ